MNDKPVQVHTLPNYVFHQKQTHTHTHMHTRTHTHARTARETRKERLLGKQGHGHLHIIITVTPSSSHRDYYNSPHTAHCSLPLLPSLGAALDHRAPYQHK